MASNAGSSGSSWSGSAQVSAESAGTTTTDANAEWSDDGFLASSATDPVVANVTMSMSESEMLLQNLTPSQMEMIRTTIQTDGQFSSDGEFTTIANAQIAHFNGFSSLNLENIKFEHEETAASASTIALLSPEQQQQLPPQHEQVAAVNVCVSSDVNVLYNAATSRDPCTQNWAGELDFKVRVQPPVKSKDAQFSKKLNKLYINQNRAVQLWFNVRSDGYAQLPAGIFIRAVPIYTRPDDFHDPVAVCRHHAFNSLGNAKSLHAQHLVRCTSEESSHYSTDQGSQRHNVLTELPNPQAGSNEVCLGYKFMDLGSCAGGLNRRDTAVIFTLEFAGGIIGRQLLSVRICTCPKRDMETDEKHEKAAPSMNPTGKIGKIKMEKSSEQEFWVLARGSDNFEALKKVGEILDTSKFGTNAEAYNEAVNCFNLASNPAVVTTPRTSAVKRRKTDEKVVHQNG